ncbi:hypothetical protein [Planctomicrobium sp. SH664]|uniref:hypothetical protein n=1 Tax=Planctomicrobium sp. SH664 TaxID=3448125 RepID=UPI003F5B38D9
MLLVDLTSILVQECSRPEEGVSLDVQISEWQERLLGGILGGDLMQWYDLFALFAPNIKDKELSRSKG